LKESTHFPLLIGDSLGLVSHSHICSLLVLSSLDFSHGVYLLLTADLHGSAFTEFCGQSHEFSKFSEMPISFSSVDSIGESVCAVISSQRSVRHMFYVVAEEFVRVYGAENSIHAGFKSRLRREVVDWLASMLSKQ
ncbi:hypothetical protein Gohar_025430, partial [Gossypium harknessii]|nr:hypothetical protein [Gossypium harknessii]